jgi:hypothetical protein
MTCAGCRIRLRASAPEIELLDGLCPICAAVLQPAEHAANALGFRAFDWDADAQEEPGEPPDTLGPPADLQARRQRALAAEELDTARWSDEGGSVRVEAVAAWPSLP